MLSDALPACATAGRGDAVGANGVAVLPGSTGDAAVVGVEALVGSDELTGTVVAPATSGGEAGGIAEGVAVAEGSGR